MAVRQNRIRYWYWLMSAFVKKHASVILVSSVISVISIIAFISLLPYFISLISTNQLVFGYAGQYGFKELPAEITSKVSNGLVFINEKGQVQPILVKTWKVEDNGKRYVVTLRDEVQWNDGTPFTTEHISYSFKDVTIQKKNDKTLVFLLKKPLPIFPTYLTKPLFKNGTVGVAGTYSIGGYKGRYEKLDEIHLVPQKKDLPRVTYRFYQTDSAMINAYKLGEISQMIVLKKSVADTFNTWGNTRIEKKVDYGRLLTLFFNTEKGVLNEKDAREGIARSIERSRWKENGEEALSPIPPLSWAYKPQMKTPTYNLETAQNLLKNYTEGSESAELTIASYYDFFEEAEAIASDLRRSGLKVTVKTLSYQLPSDFDMLLANWKVPLDPDQYYYWHSTQKEGNITNYKNVKIDKLLEDGRSTLKQEDRGKLYADFQRVIMDDLPAVFLYFPYEYVIIRK